MSGPRLKDAEVLILGNSRSLFAFPEPECCRFFEQHGLTFFHLGFPLDGQVWAEHMIEQFDLHPRLVIVNADGFFTHRASAMAVRAANSTRFDARKNYAESVLAFHVRQQLHRAIPHVKTMFFSRESFVIYRSTENGTWRIAAGQSDQARSIPPSDHGGTVEIPPEVRQSAREFRDRLQARGAELVLTYVPSPDGNRHQAEQLAAELDLPLIAPLPDGLRTVDGSHLDADSADRFATAVFEQLKEILPEPNDP